MTPTRQDIETLLALAGKATPGPRTICYTTSDADFLAACSPEVIAALCRRALEAEDAVFTGAASVVAARDDLEMLRQIALATAHGQTHREVIHDAVMTIAPFLRPPMNTEQARRQAFEEAIAIVTRYNIPTHSVVGPQMDAAIVALELARDRAPEETHD